MKKFVVNFCSSAIVLVSLFHLNACKEPTISEGGINTADDLLNMERQDSFTVEAYTVSDQQLYTSNVTQGVLGNMADPIFGNTYAGIYSQCKLSNDGTAFDSGPVLDSVVLSLPYNGKYGKLDQPLDLVVYELSQPMDAAYTDYKTNDAFRVDGNPIGTRTNFTPNLTDSVAVYGVNLAPQLRIRLSSYLGNKLLLADPTYFLNSDNFRDYFKGFYLATNTSKLGNGMVYLDMNNSNITLYYHNNVNDSLTYTFPVTSSCAKINHFDHNYAGTPVQTALNAAVPRTDSIVYIQSASGTKVKISLPYIKDLAKQKIAINKAELIVTKLQDNSGLDTLYHYPELLILKSIDDTNAVQYLPSFDKAGVSSAKDETIGGVTYHRYTLNITQFLQNLINGSSLNNGFYLTFSSALRTDRLVLSNSPSDANTKMKLKLTYTKL